MKGFLLLVLLLNVLQLCAQTNFPKGAYMNAEEIRLKNPSVHTDFIVVKLDKLSKVESHRNDYRITFADSVGKRREIVNEIWAYSDGVDLYLNTIHLNGLKWYIKVEHEGRYLIYSGSDMSKSHYYYKRGSTGEYEYTAATTVYALDLDDLNLIKVTSSRLKQWLRNTPELLEEYRNSPKRNYPDVILKYAKLRNAIAASNAAILK